VKVEGAWCIEMVDRGAVGDVRVEGGMRVLGGKKAWCIEMIDGEAMGLKVEIVFRRQQ
jgi:hypothetical protein